MPFIIFINGSYPLIEVVRNIVLEWNNYLAFFIDETPPGILLYRGKIVFKIADRFIDRINNRIAVTINKSPFITQSHFCISVYK